MQRHPHLPWFDLEPDLARYEDSGHGWLAARLSRYPEAAELASSFSFLIAAGELRYVLLEEDVDAGRFMERHPELNYSALPVIRISDFEGEQLRSLPRGTK